MNSYYDLIILIIASRSTIYDQLIKIYWLPFIDYIENNSYKIKVIFMFGNNVKLSDLNIKKENLIISNYPENLIPGINLKKINFFNIINNNYKYKHILRTNLSSFFIVDNLIKVSNELANENVYAGVIGNHKNILFGSGAGFWLSRDNILFILENKHKINYGLPDDVAVGDLMKNKPHILLKRFDLDKNKNIENKQQLLNDIINHNHYHIRIKNPIDRLIDLEYFNIFTKILYVNI